MRFECGLQAPEDLGSVDIGVIQESVEILALGEAGVRRQEGSMHTDRIQARQVSLFGLLIGVGTLLSIIVDVCALRAIKKADERDKGLQTRVPLQAFENGGPRNVIVGADAINTEHGGAASRLRGQVELARQGFCSSLGRQRVLERRANCLESLGGLLSASSRYETPEDVA